MTTRTYYLVRVKETRHVIGEFVTRVLADECAEHQQKKRKQEIEIVQVTREVA